MKPLVLIAAHMTEIRQLAKILDKHFEITIALNGEKTILTARRRQPNVILLDEGILNADGSPVCPALKQDFPETQDIPVLFLLTGNGNRGMARGQGALDYLRKPVDLNRLMLSLGRARDRIMESRRTYVKTSILILEDDHRARENLRKIFDKEGYETHVACDGNEGVLIFSQKKIDIILLDIEMPGMNGMEVLHEIRLISDDCEVIVITGHGDENTAIRALEEGAINYIRKPIDVDQVLLSVQKATDKLRLRRALLYKARDLELAHEVIAKITEEKEVIIELGQMFRIDAGDLATQLADLLPTPFLFIDGKMNVEFANLCVRELFSDTQEQVVPQVDPNLLERLGLGMVPLEELQKDVDSVLDNTKSKFVLRPLGNNRQLAVMQVTLITNKDTRKRVLMLVGGGK